MPRLLCFETFVDGAGMACRQIFDPPQVTAATDGTLILQPPPQVKATVNGVLVVLFQVLCQGDTIQIDLPSSQTPTCFRVGRVLPHLRPGAGRRCRFTGLPIPGEAMECSCGMFYSLDSARYLKRCLNPDCQRPLQDQEDPLAAGGTALTVHVIIIGCGMLGSGALTVLCTPPFARHVANLRLIDPGKVRKLTLLTVPEYAGSLCQPKTKAAAKFARERLPVPPALSSTRRLSRR